MESSLKSTTPKSTVSNDHFGLPTPELPEPDVYVVTSCGLRIPAHSGVLASMSPVLENMIDRPRKHRKSQRLIPIPGVPSDAVSAFVRFLYSSRQFKLKMQQEKKSDTALWRMLVKKVVAAKTMSSLTLPKRKRDEDLKEPMKDSGIRSFTL